MVIRFAPNKNNQKVVEEQTVWRGQNFFNNNQHVKISLFTSEVSAVCTVQHYPAVTKFHDVKLMPVSEKSGERTKVLKRS